MTSVQQLQALVRSFNEARGWRQKHQPQHLAMSIAIEAAEVLECFQWRSEESSVAALLADDGLRSRVAEELADIMIYVLSLCDLAEIDLAGSVEAKLKENEQRFPRIRER
jgi:NTP pyrophosphatase (non-canonical NTP hydrolase)